MQNQSGYLTIKDYNAEDDLYTLDVPNTEVRVGLMANLLPLYAHINPEDMQSVATQASTCLREGDYDGERRS